MIVEIVHYRDPDQSCDVAVFVDGIEVRERARLFEGDSVRYVSIDPGAGYSRSDWDAARIEDMVGLSPDAQTKVGMCYDDADESRYIDEDGE